MDLSIAWFLINAPTPLRVAVFYFFFSTWFLLCQRERPPLFAPVQDSASLQHAFSSEREECYKPNTALKEKRSDSRAVHYTRDDLLAIAPARLSRDTTSRLRELGIGCCLPRKHTRRGGRRKQRKIPVITSLRDERSAPTLSAPRPRQNVKPQDDSSKCCYSNLMTINTTLDLQDESKFLKLMCLNTQSCRNKTDDICDLITEGNFDLVFLSETWFRPVGDESAIAAVTPLGFTLTSIPRQTGTGGGLAVLYRDSLASCVEISTKDFDFKSFQVCETRLQCNSRLLIFLSIYRPPPSRKNKLTNGMFMDEFPHLLESYIACDNLFILGDINFHFDSMSDTYVASLKDLMNNLSLNQLITVPTHRRGHTLDWLITNCQTDVLDLSVTDKLISDHFVISFSLRLDKPGRVIKKVSSRNMRTLQTDVFKADLVSALTVISSDSSDLVDQYNSLLSNLLDIHAPLVTRCVTDRTSAPWMSLEIKQAKQERRRAERCWRKSHLTVSRQIYAHHRNLVTQMICDARKRYICDKITNSASSRELFQLSGQMMGAAAKTVLPTNIPTECLPDKFNEFFTGKIEQIRRNFSSDFDSSVSAPFTGIPFGSFQPVSSEQVKKVILAMPKKSCNLDPIPASLLFNCIDEISPIIAEIMNNSLNTGIVPQSFKHALVNPLLKKSNLDPENFKNYRPVSNLPFLSKVLERIVFSQLMTHLETNNLLEPFQSAYRKHHSTETALLKVINDLLQASDNGKVSILSLLDLSAAFDTIDHDILISRLSSTFGCTETVLDWFISYLSCRTQSVVVNDVRSIPSLLKYGVPQGSVLGPVLFTMYSQPLSSVIRQSGALYHFFADDSQLHRSAFPEDISSTASEIKVCIEDIADWMKMNKLKMNDEKTELMCVGTKSNLKKVSLKTMAFSDCTIAFSKSVRNLGVFLDESMSMGTHVNYLCKVLYFQLRRISKIRPFLSTDATNKLCVAFILSRLDYCNSLLAELSDDSLYKLQRIQNSAARLVLRESKWCSASALLRRLHWLPVRARIEYKVATLCFQCLKSDIMPVYLSELLLPYRPSRALRSQEASLLAVPRFSLSTFGKKSFSVFGPTTWNSLPVSLRQSKCLPTFKKHLKTHLFRKYLS